MLLAISTASNLKCTKEEVSRPLPCGLKAASTYTLLPVTAGLPRGMKVPAVPFTVSFSHRLAWGTPSVRIIQHSEYWTVIATFILRLRGNWSIEPDYPSSMRERSERWFSWKD